MIADSTRIRPAAVAGMFYPGDTQELDGHISDLLMTAPAAGEDLPKALIVPHAGTVYSGPIAATAYKQVTGRGELIRQVVLLGPSHRVYLRGLALPGVDRFETPLGEIRLDTDMIQEMIDLFPQVQRSDRAHGEEHSLEVQLPFLQKILPEFQLVPFSVGDATQKEVADVIRHVWGEEETLIILSTDLSHFHSYDQAVKRDARTAGYIESFEGEKLVEHDACGRIPLRGLLHVAREKQMRIQRFDLRNSGDTSGRRDQVVGYGAWGLYE